MPTSDDGGMLVLRLTWCGLGVVYRMRDRKTGGGKMRVKAARGGSNAGGCEPPRSPSSTRRWGAIARCSAILLSGTAAIALSIAQPAGAIVINDQVAAAAGGIANYYDAGNQFPNVVSLFNAGVGMGLNRPTHARMSDAPARPPPPGHLFEIRERRTDPSTPTLLLEPNESVTN
jgi:hypothetical protein